MKTILIFVLLVFFESPLYSQTFLNSDNNSETGGDELTPAILADMGVFTSSNPRNTEITGNSVFLTQIGEMNEVLVTTNTISSEIKIIQNGNSNKTELNYYTLTAVADLVQNGDFNNIKDLVSNPDMDISLELTQQGDNLNFVREGVNELTKSLKFIQTEASPSLIIRSFP